jgi:hypothetical protein
MSHSKHIEKDTEGERELPMEALYGIHSVCALESLPLAGWSAFLELVRAHGDVKPAYALTNRTLGSRPDDASKTDVAEHACRARNSEVFFEKSFVGSFASKEHILLATWRGDPGGRIALREVPACEADHISIPQRCVRVFRDL